MRNAFRALVPVMLASATSCSPNIIETQYQNFQIRLWGPDTTQPGASADPFLSSDKLIIKISLFEDRAGTKKYATGATLPEEFKGFKSEMTKEISDTAQTTFTFGNIAVPRLSDSQEGFFLSAEVLGMSGTDPVARARCPITEIRRKTTNDVPEKVVCRAFFGLIGRWNTLAPLTENGGHNRWQFGMGAFADGTVVVGGGRYFPTGSTTPTLDDTIQVFAPPADDTAATGHWTPVTNKLGQGRFDLTGTALGASPYVMFIGGKTGDTAFSDAIDTFNAVDLSMKGGPTITLKAKRGEHSAALLGADSVAVVGGYASATGANRSLEKVSPDGATEPGINIGSLRYPCAVQVKTDFVLVCGGDSTSDAGKKCIQTDGSSFANDSGTMSIARGDAKCAAVGGKVLIVGGVQDSSTGKKIEVWSEGTGIAPFGPELNSSLTRHAIAASNGKVIVTGGYAAAATDEPLDTGYLIDPANATVTPLSGADFKMASKRAWHQMAAFPDGTVMAVGGKPKLATDKVGVEMYVVPD